MASLDQPRRLDRDLIRAELRALGVVQHFGISGKVIAGQIRTRMCPRCGQRTRDDAVAISVETSLWHCFVCGQAGDVFALVAGYGGLDVQHDFAAVLDLSAEICGHVPPTDSTELERRRRARADREAGERVEREAEAAAQLEAAKFKAAATWKRARKWHAVGAAYLRARGLDPRFLVENGYARFGENGDICVQLWAFDGELINVVRRVINSIDGAPKVVGLLGCPTSGSLCGRVQEIQRGDVLLLEGVADTLTAAQLWRDRVVLGAHGAGRLPVVAAAAAPRVKAAGGRLVIVPDADETGQGWALRAGVAAVDHGLAIDTTLIIRDVIPHADLNAAHCAGWKP